MKKLGLFFMSSALLALTAGAFSQFAQEDHIQTVIAPACFLDQTSIAYTELATVENLKLIQAHSQDLALIREQVSNEGCGYYLDLSTDWQNKLNEQKNSLTADFTRTLAEEILRNELNIQNQKLDSIVDANFQISYQTQVNDLLGTFDAQRMWNDLSTLTKFPDRASSTDNGVKAAHWFKEQVEKIAQAAGRTDVTARLVNTGIYYKQPSVVVTIAGTDPNAEGVLIGGHMDTLTGTKPGADDDGSGSVTVLETARVIINSPLRFKRTMYFAWYAAEEQGLIGSGVVASEFVTKKIPLRGVLQLDMTGYNPTNVNKIWLITDNTDANLTKFVGELGVTYAKAELVNTSCGYACSDHASWTRKGYKSAMPFEAPMNADNPYIHTANDTMQHISLEHMSRYAKISIAFMAELGEPTL